ncbi:uncharacterized protein K02A2.6-like [Corticium candelabrum]|uniref:uncharacterized protein K02A2.6-like n=1 Tax=Corticium candelabrum TaxID=121492 RepID=UPI002E26C841|nr:uncharacterized protein K02A2.6-like [Corticium candelabrum]
MNDHVKTFIQRCAACREVDPAQPKLTLIPHTVPSRPWAKVAVDLFVVDRYDYMVTVDYMSNFWEVDRLDSLTSQSIIQKLKPRFARHGIPDTVMSDNGPQFVSGEFSCFSQNWGFDYVTSSLGYPQSNGKVENAVKTTKRLMAKARQSGGDLWLAFLEFQNTPSQGFATSSAQRLMNRRTKTLFPMTESLLVPRECSDESAQRAHHKAQQARYYNQGTTDLPLQPGDIVRIQPRPSLSTWQKGTVQKKVGIRSYQVKADGDTGGTYVRNCRHLRRSHEVTTEKHPLQTQVSEQRNAESTATRKQSARQSSCHTTWSGRMVKPPKYLDDYTA